MRVGHPVVFDANGDTLPTGLSHGTTYYVESVPSSDTFTLSETEGGAAINTSGSQSGTHILVGDYWYNLPATDPGNGGNYKARYGTPGSELAYPTMFQYMDQYQKNNASFFDDVVIECQGAWTDTEGQWSSGVFFEGFHAVTITTKINGVRDADAYHYGKPGSGYVFKWDYGATPLRIYNLNTFIDGIEVIATGDTATVFCTDGMTVHNCILSSTTRGSSTVGISGHGVVEAYNNIVHNTNIGIRLRDYSGGWFVAHNLVFNCVTGIEGQDHDPGYVIGNIAIDCTTNWGNPPDAGMFSNNAGETGDAIWASTGQSSVVATTADFMNYDAVPTANSDYMPNGDIGNHTGNSVFIEAAQRYFPQNMPAHDVRLKNRPRWKDGQATEWDIGPIEFDWGYGDKPETYTLTLTDVMEGTQVTIVDSTSRIELQNSVATSSGIVTYEHNGSGTVDIMFMHLDYDPNLSDIFDLGLPSSNSSIKIQQIDDTNYDNPA